MVEGILIPPLDKAIEKEEGEESDDEDPGSAWRNLDEMLSKMDARRCDFL